MKLATIGYPALLCILASSVAAQEFVPVNLYVADLTYRGNTVTVGPPRKITGDRGVSSQPSFTPDGRAVLFIGRRDSANAQSDVYRIDLSSGTETRITSTPEMENSPTVTPDGNLMVIRWIPATLFTEWGPWIYDMKGQPLRGVLPAPDTVGYYVRIDSVTYAMVRPVSTGSSVAIFDARSGTMTNRDAPVANLPPQLIPGQRAISYTRTDSLGRNEIKRLDPFTSRSSVLMPALLSRVAHAWTPNGTVIMGKANKLFVRNPARDTAWREIASFADKELRNVTAYTVSPKGDKLILISPVKPPLHTFIRDAIESGKSASSVLAPLENQSPQAIRDSYDLSRGALTGIVNSLKQKSPAEAAVLETFLSRIMKPAASP